MQFIPQLQISNLKIFNLKKNSVVSQKIQAKTVGINDFLIKFEALGQSLVKPFVAPRRKIYFTKNFLNVIFQNKHQNE